MPGPTAIPAFRPRIISDNVRSGVNVDFIFLIVAWWRTGFTGQFADLPVLISFLIVGRSLVVYLVDITSDLPVARP